jgi:hypothetical protein
MIVAANQVTVQPDPALLCAVGEHLAQVLASNRRLAQNPTINFHARRRIEAVITGLIATLDRLDGDSDIQQTAAETRGRGFPADLSLDDAEPEDGGFEDIRSYLRGRNLSALAGNPVF